MNTPRTPPPCRWPVLITSPTLAKFQLVWRRLCDVVLFPSYLVEDTLTVVCVLPHSYLTVVHIKYILTFYFEYLNGR